MNDVLLTVSGTIPSDLDQQIAKGERPEADYRAMARAFSADLLDYAEARRTTDAFGRFLERTAGKNAMLAWSCFQRRHRYRAIFTDGEQVGLPLAFFLKRFGQHGHRPAHLMIVHVLSPRKKALLVDSLGLHSHIDTFLVYSSWQQHFIRERWQLPDHRVVLTPFMVDAEFFSPTSVVPSQWPSWLTEIRPPLICAVGLERRDYATLIEAVRGLDVRVIIAAASPWSKQSDTTQGRDIPGNVIVRKFTQYELRFLYAASCFLVMPLYDVDFQAGVTAILEAMAMSKAVVCTRTRGQTDTIVEKETGLYVPPRDIQALRSTIVHLLERPEEAERLGRQGRGVVEERMSLEHYCKGLAQQVALARALPVTGPSPSGAKTQ